LDREAVVAAAATLVDEEGLAGLTLARLAERLGVRYQSLYSHVSSPAELQRALQERYCRALGDVTRRAAVGRAGRDGLLAICRAHLAFDRAHPGLVAVHWSLGATDGQRLAIFDDATSALTVVLRSYGLRGAELAHWRRAVASTVFGFSSLLNASLLRSSPDPGGTFELLIETLADALEQRQASARPARGARAG
jgi:AcrR family transcriptional regulator